MKVISKTISYDNLLSRLPSVVPAIADYWEFSKLYTCTNTDETEKYYSYSSAVKRAYEYNLKPSDLTYGAEFIDFTLENLTEFSIGNYGLVASDVIIPDYIASGITDYTDLYVNIPVGDEKRNKCKNLRGEDIYEEFYNLSWPLDSNFTKPSETDYDKCSITDPHYEFVNGRYGIYHGEQEEIKIITQYTLNKWYTFFLKYYQLIERPEFARSYSSATEYYEFEFKDKNDDLRKEYEELDRIFNSRGGYEMYKWISNNLAIQFMIPEEFSDEWKETKLYYPEALKWYWWFKDRIEKYKSVLNLEDCANSDDCCDCTEYIKRGGYDFYSALAKWLDNLPELNSDYATRAASVTLTVNLQNSIDDLGEMSILSSDWGEEVDYHNTLIEKGYVTLGDGGTVVNKPYLLDEYGEPVYLNDTYIIKNGDDHKGYYYNNYFENVFKKEDWSGFTDFYMAKYPYKFASDYVTDDGVYEAVTSYTYSPLNGKIIYNPREITSTVPIIGGECTCILGETYDIIDGKYVQLCYTSNAIADINLKKSNKLPIYKDGDLEYALYNGRRKYVKLDSKGVERVYFLKDSNCYDEGCVVNNGKYIIYDGNLKLIDDASASIILEDDESRIYYHIADKYFDYNGNRFYIKNGKITIQEDSQFSEEIDAYDFDFRELTKEDLDVLNLVDMVYDAENNIVTLYHKFNIIKCSLVSGYTNSKLELLRRKEITTDELGNELPGFFKSIVDIDRRARNSIYNNPYDECVLDILYKVGEVSELKYLYSNTNTDERYFTGNYLESIRFYYVDDLGNELTDDDDNILEKYTGIDNAVSTINDLEAAMNSLEKIIDSYHMMCDITYYIGATIQNVNGKYSLPNEAYFDRGVKYVDTVFVSKETGIYYLADGNSFTFNYFSMQKHVKKMYVSDYNAVATSDIAYFEYQPWIYHIKMVNGKETLYQLDEIKYGSDKHWAKRNNNIVAPIFRQEFNLASSFATQNDSSDIYIDRGINAAFEKHLKLQEFRTMEALENYGNGYFKINKF